MMNASIRSLWVPLLFASLGVGSSARAQSLVTVSFSGSSGGVSVSGNFCYLQTHAPMSLGDFEFLGSADKHTLTYTIQNSSVTFIESCTNGTCNQRYSIRTRNGGAPRAYHMDVAWRDTSGNAHEAIIDFTALKDLDLRSLPLCDAFVQSSTVATGTFSRKLNGVLSPATPITISVTTCAAAAVPAPTMVPCPVYVHAPQPRCCLSRRLFACRRPRLCRG